SISLPPVEVFDGKSIRSRRLCPDAPTGKRWWDINFLPLCGAEGVVSVLGRIQPLAGLADTAEHSTSSKSPAQSPPTIERLAQLRQRVYSRYQLDSLQSTVPAMRRAVEQARLASQNRFPVLIQGEAGTGKEW